MEAWWTLRQIWWQGDVSIYHQTKPGYKVEAFEVIRIRTARPSPGTLVEYDLKEVYPSSEEWGRCGYTYKTLVQAGARAAEFVNQYREEPL